MEQIPFTFKDAPPRRAARPKSVTGEQGRARHTDPDTSREAAESVDATRLQSLVLGALKSAGPSGLTTEELSERLNLSLVTVSPRLSPMEKKGLVARAGRRPNRSGRTAIVWRATG